MKTTRLWDLSDPGERFRRDQVHGMELLGPGWVHLDYTDYGDGLLSDEEFAKAERERDPAKVVTRAMIEAQDTKGKGHD